MLYASSAYAPPKLPPGAVATPFTAAQHGHAPPGAPPGAVVAPTHAAGGGAPPVLAQHPAPQPVPAVAHQPAFLAPHANANVPGAQNQPHITYGQLPPAPAGHQQQINYGQLPPTNHPAAGAYQPLPQTAFVHQTAGQGQPPQVQQHPQQGVLPAGIIPHPQPVPAQPTPAQHGAVQPAAPQQNHSQPKTGCLSCFGMLFRRS
jgi:hypothetical protein